MIAGPGRGRRSASGSGSGPGGRRALIVGVVCAAGLMLTAVLGAPVVMFASGSLLTESSASCSSGSGNNPAVQPVASRSARNSIPANYLTLFQTIGKEYKVPWVILAGIGKVESDDGQSTLPGVHSGANAFGAAGPMQIGIGGAAGNQWGGAPVHPAREKVNGVATDANSDGLASVYEPADAIAGAAKYLLAHGVLSNVDQAIFAYNHLESYVQAVLYWAGLYASGGYTVSPVTLDSAPECLPGAARAPSAAVATAIGYAEQQLGKPYLWGGTGPDAFDCSGLVMMAYRAAGIDIPRTSEQQWAWGARVSAPQVQPGDLVFFAGADGTPTSPGHVGLVIGGGLMIEAYATGFPIRIAPYGDRDPVGFTRPWGHTGVAPGTH
ncbi:MAG TPA: C40 family peptidase [Streptosporangiaceae bacterium]|nr:C40 family peptidase [Streptosporangiaceae bacterium]